MNVVSPERLLIVLNVPPSLLVSACDKQRICSAKRGRTDLCERRRFLREAESRWSALVMNPKAWMEEVQLSFWVKKKKEKKYRNSSVPLFLK